MQDMSPRRSPRFKKPSPKPELPKKPRKPERVMNPVENSVRQANYQVELAAWEAAKVEHAHKMQHRQGKQAAAWKAARAEKQAPPPAAPPAALAPPPQLSADEARLVGLPALAERRKFAAVAPPPPPPPAAEEERFPRLRRSLARWVLDVEAVAARCGAHEAQPLFRKGNWYDFREYGGVPSLAPPAPTPHDARACCVPCRRIRHGGGAGGHRRTSGHDRRDARAAAEAARGARGGARPGGAGRDAVAPAQLVG